MIDNPLNDQSLAEAALAYAALGYRVHPLKTGTKDPRLSRWHERATSDESKVRSWWTRWPDSNIALLPPPGFYILDPDAADGKDGLAQLADLEAEIGEIPRDVVQRSARGGRHILVKGERPTRKRAAFPHIDLKGPNEYFIAAPSVLADGRKYEWLTDTADPANARPAPSGIYEAFQSAGAGQGDGSRSDRHMSACRDSIRHGLTYAEHLEELDHELFEYSQEERTAGQTKGERDWQRAMETARKEGDLPLDVEAEFDDLDEVDAPRKRKGLTFLSANELDKLPEPFDFIRNVAFDNQLVVIYGEPGCGKSFLALDMCAKVGLGLHWFGRETVVRKSLYIALEGTGGLKRRLHAWRRYNRQETPPIDFATGFLALGTDKAAQKEIIRHMKASDTKLVVIDTVARAMPGQSENDPKDMGALIAGADLIRRTTGATVILIAHSGKDATRGVRGHSSLKGAADLEIEVTRDEEQRIAKITKSKDGEEAAMFPFRLEPVATGLTDARGEPITSVAVNECDSFVPTHGLKGRDAHAFDVITDLSDASLIDYPTEPEWIEALKKASWLSDDTSKDTWGRTYRRTRNKLRDKGLIAISPDGGIRVEL